MEEHLPTVYEEIGGENTLKALVKSFYDIMDTNPEFEIIRKLHNNNLDEAREKLFMFLSGWMGGPPLYINKYGHPRLRMRHFPFPIAEIERDQWVKCMALAMQEVKLAENIQKELLRSLYQVADFMRNKQ